jgi:DNA polymerase-3 subunit alpha
MSYLTYNFDCGCQVKQFGTDVKDCDGLPQLEIDFYNIPDCPLIWDMFCEGNTKGIFQLETNVGKGISKNLAPRNVEELSALIALMRPGCANSMSEGKSMTDHYIDRKHNREATKNIDDSLEDILDDTFQVLVFQEQSIAIAVKIAGLTPVEADMLRKSMGTKDAALMNQVETLFIDGCRKVGLVSDEQAKNIFEMIRSSNRYAFNRSHSAAYA